MRSVTFGVASTLITAAPLVAVTGVALTSCQRDALDDGRARTEASRSQGSGAPSTPAPAGSGNSDNLDAGGASDAPKVKGPYPDGIVFGEQTRLRGYVSCADLGLGTVSTIIDGVDVKGGATFPLGAGHSVTLFDDSVTAQQTEPPFRDLSHFQFFFTATLGIDAVIVQGGPDSLVSEYCPAARAALGLVAPFQCFTDAGVPTGDDFDSSTCAFGLPYAIRRVELCYRQGDQDGGRICPDKTW